MGLQYWQLGNSFEQRDGSCDKASRSNSRKSCEEKSEIRMVNNISKNISEFINIIYDRCFDLLYFLRFSFDSYCRNRRTLVFEESSAFCHGYHHTRFPDDIRLDREDGILAS